MWLTYSSQQERFWRQARSNPGKGMQTARRDKFARKKIMLCTDPCTEQGKGPAAGSEWRCCSQYKAPSTQGNRKSKVKNTLPRSNRGREPKWPPLVRRGRARHKTGNQNSPCWEGQEDLKAYNWGRVKVQVPQHVPKYQANRGKEKFSAPQKARKKSSEHHKKQKGDLRWTVLLYSLSSTKYNFKSYCLIMEHNTGFG